MSHRLRSLWQGKINVRFPAIPGHGFSEIVGEAGEEERSFPGYLWRKQQ
ncbi:MAG: hypothetical protein WBH59_01410 [Atribacterales bacterium]